MWEQLQNDVHEVDKIEGVVRKNLKSPATSSPPKVTTELIIDNNDRVGEMDKLLSYAASVEKRIDALGEDLKRSTLNRSYISMVQPKLESFSRKVTAITNQLETMDLTNDKQFSLIPLVSIA